MKNNFLDLLHKKLYKKLNNIYHNNFAKKKKNFLQFQFEKYIKIKNY